MNSFRNYVTVQTQEESDEQNKVQEDNHYVVTKEDNLEPNDDPNKHERRQDYEKCDLPVRRSLTNKKWGPV